MIQSISSAIFSEHRPVQIIPSVLPADWANMGQCVKDLELAGVDRIQFDVIYGPAYKGAPTHPGGKNEVRTYADI